MRTIIAGGRDFDDYDKLAKVCSSFTITEVYSGCARGADKLGERYANENGIPITRYPADWEFYGKKAGILRNIYMVEVADFLIAFWDGKSKGTKHVIETAKKEGLGHFVSMY